MLKNPDSRLNLANAASPFKSTRTSAPEQGRVMRQYLSDFLQRLASGTQVIRRPPAGNDTLARGEGHFHLAPELFLQVSGSTQFRFGDASLLLEPGQVLILPPRVLHAERIPSQDATSPFRNVVIYAEGTALTCHLAHEIEPGRPGILHLEARLHPQAPHIHNWLSDAARSGATSAATDATTSWANTQTRALIAAATAGVLQALDDADTEARPEPPLVARARVLIKNQLGDQQLSVRGLAEQSNCTADYLSHVFRQTTGEHLAAFITRLRMERAARLLQDPTLAGKEIAWACGYATQSYFIRTFRSHFGMTPKDWRSSNVEPA